MSLLSFLFSLDFEGKGGGRAVASLVCVFGAKPMLKQIVGHAYTTQAATDSSSKQNLASTSQFWKLSLNKLTSTTY